MRIKTSDTDQMPINHKYESEVEKAPAGSDTSSDDLNPQQKRSWSIRRFSAMRWVELQDLFRRLYERSLFILSENDFLYHKKIAEQEKDAQTISFKQGIDEEFREKDATTNTVQQHLTQFLEKLYKAPIKSASGKQVKVSVGVKKDNHETPFEPTLQSMGDESPGYSTSQYSSLHLCQHDLDSGLVQDLGHFRVSHRNNPPGGITGLQITGIKPEDLEDTTPWEDSRTDQYSRAFEVMGASNQEFRLKVKDVDKISVEARKGLGTSLENAKVAAYRLTFESRFGRYKFNKEHIAFVSESWGDADVYRTNPMKIRNLNQNCPISGKAINNPVLASDGCIYEKEAIEGRSTSGQLRLLTVEETKHLLAGVGKENSKENSLASEQQDSLEAQPEPSPEEQSEPPLETQRELPEAVEIPQAQPYNGRMLTEAECISVDEPPEVVAIRIDDLSENKTAEEEFLSDPRPDFTRENQDPTAPPLEPSSSPQLKPSSSSNNSQDNYHLASQAPSAPRLESPSPQQPTPSSSSRQNGSNDRPNFTGQLPSPSVRAETTFTPPSATSNDVPSLNLPTAAPRPKL